MHLCDKPPFDSYREQLRALAAVRLQHRLCRAKAHAPVGCLAEEAVLIEPVSSPKFTANREINREFSEIRPSPVILASNQRVNSPASSQIP